MAIRFDSPVFPALDANGDPVSGAKLNFYESGTTTRLDTFSDEGLTSANANPVVANSAGRFGDIWMKAQDYKAVLTDSADATIWTRDPVQGALVVSGDEFKASQQSPADMTVQLSAGNIFNIVTKALVVVAAQNSASITAPSNDPRRDIVFVDRLTGVVGVQTGAEAASPVDPTIADDKLPVARITLATTTTEIDDSLITDIRELNLLGAGDLVRFSRSNIQDQTFSYATAVAGTADVVTATFSPTLTALTEGMRLALKVDTTNTGAVTLNPDTLGAIDVKKNDGATALDAGDWTAGQIVVVEYDGANFQMVSNVASMPVDVQTLAGSGTWTDPGGISKVLVLLWAAGGSGGTETTDGGGGGGGGGYAAAWFDAADTGATETVTIGAGGAAVSANDTNGNDGGNSTFGSLLTAYGGEGGVTNGGEGGGGGGLFAKGASSAGGGPLGGAAGSGASGGISTFGGGGGGDGSAGSKYDGGASVDGGGGGGGGKGSSDDAGVGGQSHNGGGGGGGGDGSVGGAGGVSTVGGNGGAGAATTANATAGTQPGGGGGGSETGDSGAGGDGQCIVISW